jgi:hypothetical protein
MKGSPKNLRCRKCGQAWPERVGRVKWRLAKLLGDRTIKRRLGRVMCRGCKHKWWSVHQWALRGMNR